jgi:FG-GAP-like repeat
LKTIARAFGRFIGRTLSVAATVCLLASPADAAIDADFNGDGVLDRVVLPRPPETRIVVRLSGSAPQILTTYDRIVSIVAADINHDGEIDLSALSERRGVFVWLNKGKASNGHLRALKRKHHRGGFALSTGGPLASAPESARERPAATSSQDDRDPADHERVAHDFGHRRASDRCFPLVATLLDDRGDASPSRAPPTP